MFRDTDVGLLFRWIHNEYADPIPVTGCGSIRREDRRGQIAPYVDWHLHPRFAYRMTASYEFRRSNCEVFNYNAVEFGVGVVLGWF